MRTPKRRPRKPAPPAVFDAIVSALIAARFPGLRLVRVGADLAHGCVIVDVWTDDKLWREIEKWSAKNLAWLSWRGKVRRVR